MHKFISIVGIILVGVIIGWICPIEGPYDYVYDKYASQPAHRNLVNITPAPKQIIVNITDLSLDDLELLDELFQRSTGTVGDEVDYIKEN